MNYGSQPSEFAPPAQDGGAFGINVGNGMFVPKRYATADGLYWGSPETSIALEPGFYEPLDTRMGPALRRLHTKNDSLLRLPDPVCDMLLKEFVDFWERSPEMARRGLIQKRGLMLWGPPGSGKTSALQIMAQHMIREMRGIVVMVGQPNLTAQSLQLLRIVEPERPVILVYEDIDALVESHGEAGYLALLDGEFQISGVVNVATTNYPERLDKRFTDRPGRFDRVTLVGMPLPAARRAYFAAKAPDIAEDERERWVNVSEGWSLAHLRELIVAHIVLGERADDVIDRLTTMRERPPESRDSHPRDFGFVSGANKLRAVSGHRPLPR